MNGKIVLRQSALSDTIYVGELNKDGSWKWKQDVTKDFKKISDVIIKEFAESVIDKSIDPDYMQSVIDMLFRDYYDIGV